MTEISNAPVSGACDLLPDVASKLIGHSLWPSARGSHESLPVDDYLVEMLASP